MNATARITTAATPPATLATAPDWIDTPTSVAIIATLAFAQATADVAVVYGAPGVGKTHSARRFAQQSASVWHAVMSPANSGVVPSLQEACAAMSIPVCNGAAPLHRAIVRRAIGSGGLLIVDEAHHLSAVALDQLRSVHDAAAIGLVLIGNRDVYARLIGGDSAMPLDRLRSRIGRRLQVMATSEDDAEAVAAAWGIQGAGARRLIAEVAAKSGGMRSVVKMLRLAHTIAGGTARPLAEGDLRKAWRELGGA